MKNWQDWIETLLVLAAVVVVAIFIPDPKEDKGK